MHESHVPPVASLFREHKQLDMSHTNPDEVDKWKSSFLRAGVFPEDVQSNGAETPVPTDGRIENLRYFGMIISRRTFFCLLLNGQYEYMFEFELRVVLSLRFPRR